MPAKKFQPQKAAAAATVDSATRRLHQTQAVVHAEKRELFEGPLPHPELLKQYEQTLPGIAERIVKMAEIEQTNRLALAREDSEHKAKLIEIANRESAATATALARGQIIGLAISIICVILAFVCAYMKMSEWTVVAFLAVPTASFISAFIPRKNRELKS